MNALTECELPNTKMHLCALTQHFSKLALAAAYLAQENVEFVACNCDATFPAIPGLQLPGAGRCINVFAP